MAGAVSLVERVNALRGAPVTGSPLHFVMTTGDNTDNNSKTELDWFLKVMSGGRVTPNSGDPRRYEGVQNSGLKLYWQPDAALRDADKQLGFPRLNGFLAAAIREVNSPGLNVPWYSTVGNHDSLPGGCYAPGDSFFADFAVGGRKLMTLDERGRQDPLGQRQERRRPPGRRVEGHPQGPGEEDAVGHPGRGPRPLHPAGVPEGPPGPGPHAAPARSATATRRPTWTPAPSTTPSAIADDVIGISLDSTDPGGHYEGSHRHGPTQVAGTYVEGGGQGRFVRRRLQPPHQHVDAEPPQGPRPPRRGPPRR